MRNFVSDMLAFHEWAMAEELSANEIALFIAIFFVMNERRWPEGPVGITNNQLLAHCPFYSTKRDDVLRETRESLAKRGVLRYEKGEAFRARAQYEILWDVILGNESEPDSSPDRPESVPDLPPNRPQKGDEKWGSLGGKSLINVNEKENPNENQTVVPEISDQSLPESDTHSDLQPQSTIAGARARWFDPARPEAECDSAWRTSPPARSSIAQRIIDHLEQEHGLDTSVTNPELPGLHRLICLCMEAGMPPGAITRAGIECAGEAADFFAEELILRCSRTWGGLSEYAEPIYQREQARKELILRIRARDGGGCRDDP